MAKRYLGYGYTNAQGVAKLEYDADGEPLTHSYTGVGAGKVDIVAESGSLQSESYGLIDALFYDKGTDQTSLGSNWWVYVNSGSVSEDSTGILVDGTNGAEIIYANLSGTSSSSEANIRDYIAPYCVEFDCVSISGNVNYSTNWNSSQNNQSLSFVSNGDKVRIVNDGTNIKYYLNGSDTASATQNLATGSDKAGCGIRASTGGVLKFKEFKIYPI